MVTFDDECESAKIVQPNCGVLGLSSTSAIGSSLFSLANSGVVTLARASRRDTPQRLRDLRGRGVWFALPSSLLTLPVRHLHLVRAGSLTPGEPPAGERPEGNRLERAHPRPRSRRQPRQRRDPRLAPPPV